MTGRCKIGDDRAFHIPSLKLLLGLLSLAFALAPLKAMGASDAKAASGETSEAGTHTRAPSRHYVHSWIPMPKLVGTALPANNLMSHAPIKGRTFVVVFLASWCEPCQQIAEQIVKIEERFRNLNTDFVYVFTHDTADDAQGFMKEMGIRQGLLASQEVLKDYHNPELPTIYVGDRQGWLATRYPRTSASELTNLTKLLTYLTAY